MSSDGLLCDSRWVEQGKGTVSPGGRATSLDKVVQQLAEMGFDEAQAREVLAANGGDMTAAVQVLASM